MEIGIEIYALLLKEALPISIAFALCNFVVETYLGMLLRGRTRLGG